MRGTSRVALGFVSCSLLGGCYLELGFGVGMDAGPKVEREAGWVFTVSSGGDLGANPSGTRRSRGILGSSVEWTGSMNHQPEAIGVTVGGDVGVGGSDDSPLRLSGRVTPLSISWVEDGDSERGYVVPVYLGIAKAFDCNEHWCSGQVGVGLDTLMWHRPDDGYGAFVAPQFRITMTSSLLDNMRASTGRAP